MGCGQRHKDEERIVLQALVRAANAGQRCPTADDLLELLPHLNSVSTTVVILKRLERKGMIKVDRYQRARRVTILKSGKATAAPSSLAPHWRDRPRDVPAPAQHVVQQRKPDTAAQIFAEARKLGISPQDFLAQLVWEGWATRLDSAEDDPRVRMAG